MRGLKTTVFLGVVLAALAAYIFLVENRKPDGLPAKAKAWTVDAATIVDVTIRSAAGDTTRLQKGANTGRWSMVEPVNANVDEAVVSSIVSGLAGLEIERVLDENPAGLKDYGLDPARIEVTFRTGADSTERRLRLGEKTPGSAELYAQTEGSKAVVLVASFLENSFNKGTFELRDKNILTFDRTKADKLEIAYGTTTLSFAKSGDVDWSMSKPFAARGDFAAIDGAISALSTTQVQRFVVDGDAGDLKQYGLDRPELTATVTSEGQTVTLAIGGPVDGTRYAKRSTGTGIVTVGENLLADLKKGGDDFRRRDLFDFRAFTGTRIEVVRGADTLTLEKVKGKDETTPDTWKAGTGKTTDAIKAEESLVKVTGLRADRFVPAVPAGLGAPAAVVTATFGDDNRKEVVRVFVRDADVYATREGEPGAAVITRTGWDEALKALDGLK
ncbi:MAG: DUF4340 domain-containing protein [Vicinamibacterales bacterium]